MQSAQRTALTAALTSVAHSLAGADGGNVEYDRALVDLTSAVLAIDRAAVAERILAPASPLLNDGTPGQSALGTDLGSTFCGRYWVRTSDLFGVNEALYH
ncbi:MAG: hypothetical protein JWP62_167 [Blastococcus sp.]|nr:hypothetical protein [Blastococcus sp.]